MSKLIIHPKDKSTGFLTPIYDGRDDVTVITGGTKENVYENILKHDEVIMLGHGTPQGLMSVGQFNKPVNIAKPVSTIQKPSYRFQSQVPAVTKDDIKSAYTSDVTDEEPDFGYNSAYGGDRYVSGYQSSIHELTTGYIINDDTADMLRNKKLTSIWCNADQYIEWNNLHGFYTGMFVSEVSEARMIGLKDAEQWQVDESNYAFSAVVREHLDDDPDDLLRAVLKKYGAMAERNPVARYNYRRMYVIERLPFLKEKGNE